MTCDLRMAVGGLGFDDVFGSHGAEMLLTPVQAPNANADAEQWIRTVRTECLDWLLIIGGGHLEQVLRVDATHYNYDDDPREVSGNSGGDTELHAMVPSPCCAAGRNSAAAHSTASWGALAVWTRAPWRAEYTGTSWSSNRRAVP